MQNDKLRYNTSQYQKQLNRNFNKFSLNLIRDKTIITLCLYCSAIGYVKDGTSHFTDITNADDLTLNLDVRLDYRLKQEKKEKNNEIPVINSKKAVMKKKNLYVEKKIVQLENMA